MGEKASSLGSGGQAGGAQRTPLKVFVEISVLAAVFAEMGGLCKRWLLLFPSLAKGEET